MDKFIRTMTVLSGLACVAISYRAALPGVEGRAFEVAFAVFFGLLFLSMVVIQVGEAVVSELKDPRE